MNIKYQKDLKCLDQTCSICLEVNSNTKLSCNHDCFCDECITTWTRTNSSCPMCRTTIQHIYTSSIKYKELTPKEEVFWEVYDLVIKCVPEKNQMRYMNTIYPIVKKYPPKKLLRLFDMYKGQIEFNMHIATLPSLLEKYYKYKGIIEFRISTISTL